MCPLMHFMQVCKTKQTFVTEGKVNCFIKKGVHQRLNMLFFHETILENVTCETAQMESKIY